MSPGEGEGDISVVDFSTGRQILNFYGYRKILVDCVSENV